MKMADKIFPYFLHGEDNTNAAHAPEQSLLQPKPQDSCGPPQENMDIMSGYPRSPGHAAPLRERRWYQYALQLWKEWGHRLDEHERITWKRELPFLRTNGNRKTWGGHRFCSREDLTWTHWTFLRIMFPLDWILRSKVALRVQVKFPQADITQWAPNNNGPTRDQRFRASRHVVGLPGEIYNPRAEHRESANDHIKAETSSVNRGPGTGTDSPKAEGDNFEFSSSESPDPMTDWQAPAISVQPPVDDGTKPHGEDLSSAFQRRTEMAGQTPPEFSIGSRAGLETEEEKITKLEQLASDMRRNEMRQMRQEMYELRRDLEKANERIVQLEAARARQDQERAALREAFAQNPR